MKVGRWSMTLLVAALAWASPVLGQAKVDGAWTGVLASPQGNQTVTLTLAAADTLLTGKITNFQGGEQDIEDGVIKGDSISFWQTLSFDGNMLEIFYSALVKAEEMLFSVEVAGMPQGMSFTAKRVP